MAFDFEELKSEKWYAAVLIALGSVLEIFSIIWPQYHTTFASIGGILAGLGGSTYVVGRSGVKKEKLKAIGAIESAKELAKGSVKAGEQ